MSDELCASAHCYARAAGCVSEYCYARIAGCVLECFNICFNKLVSQNSMRSYGKECFKRNVAVFVKHALGKNNEGGNTKNCTVAS